MSRLTPAAAISASSAFKDCPHKNGQMPNNGTRGEDRNALTLKCGKMQSENKPAGGERQEKAEKAVFWPQNTNVLMRGNSVSHQISSVECQNRSVLERSNSVLIQTTSKMLQGNSGLPRDNSVMFQTTSILFQSNSGLLQTTGIVCWNNSGLLPGKSVLFQSKSVLRGKRGRDGVIIRGIIQMTNKWVKTGRAGSPLPAERLDLQAAARTE